MLHFHISDSSEVAYARRQVTALAQTLSMTTTDVGNVALVVTEIGTNILKHAVRGELIAHEVTQNQTVAIELLALDSGPGMANVSECLRDGYSTAGSPGTGLGAIVRIATRVEIFSLPEIGTAIFARIAGRSHLQRQWTDGSTDEALRDEAPRPTVSEEFATGVVSVAKADQTVCGDGWATSQSSQRYRLMVADGIGHGPKAEEAVQDAVRIFHQRIAASLVDLLGAMHSALRSTRGAVAAVAEINRAEELVHYCGVGNISATLLTAQSSRRLVSLNGIVGHQFPSLKVFSYPWNPQTLLVMHSDGLTSRWSVDRYPGIFMQHPALIAGVLYRDFNRGGRDDVTVAVAKVREKQ